MMTNLSSHFAQYMTEMMEIKRNSGFSLNYMYSHLSEFDEFCLKNFPDKHQLDQELVQAWVYDTNTKSRSELDRRVRTMRHLAKHMTALGISAHFSQIRIAIPKPAAPHIFTDEQLAEFFHVCDSFEPVTFPQYRHLLYPTLFRVIYCCGLRNSEACNLKRRDVNLKNGILKVIGSKGHRDRVVYLAPDLQELCNRYDVALEAMLPEREYFFPSQRSKHFLNSTIGRIFNELLAETSFFGKTSKKPTCHGLRHTFACNSMRQCLASGGDFNSYIQYLSKYMGHKNPQETMYYLHMVVNIIPELRAKAKGFEDVIGGVFHVEE